MNGIPHLQHVRSASLAGLSVVNLIFDDDSDNDWDRQKVLERLVAGDAAAERFRADRPRFQPHRLGLLVHAEEHQSRTTT